MNYAQIVVNAPLTIGKPIEQEGDAAESLRERAFTYSIPERLADSIALGQLVWVPFGARRLQGVVIAFSDSSPVEQTKEIEAIVDARPFLSPIHLDLARWIARTYLCSLHAAIGLMLPPGVEQQTEILLALAPPSTIAQDVARDNLTEKQAALVELLARDGETKLRALPRELHSAIKSLEQRGIITKQSIVTPPQAQPKRIKFVRLIADDTALDSMLATVSRRNPRADALEYLAQQGNTPVSIEKVCEAVDCSQATLNTLAKKNWIDISPSQTLISLTLKYFADLPAVTQTQSRVLVYLRERGAPVSIAELKTNGVVLRALESKGYITRTRVDDTVALKLAPSDAIDRVRELRGTKHYATIVNFLREAGAVWINAIYAETRCTRADLQRLEAAGVVAFEEQADILLALASDFVRDNLTPEQTALIELLARDGETKLRVLPCDLRSAVKSLEQRGMIAKRSIDIPPKAQPKRLKFVRLISEERIADLHPRMQDKARRVADFLRGEAGAVWISAVYAETGCTRADLQKLEAAGVVALEEEEVWRDSLAGRAFEIAEPPKLTEEQARVWVKISSRLEVQSSRFKVQGSKFEVQTSNLEPETLNREPQTSNREPETFLLHGVTGSGKTEIYIRALAEIIAQGKQGIVLVPEISLTPQTIRRFGARFKRIAVVHSQLSIGERYDTWRRCRDGLVDVVIGARSALFAPLPNLGLIAMDEEHDPSYKQADVPHYHAREVALELARRAGAIVILGDATPDVETYYRATRGEFVLLELPKRVMGHAQVIQNSKLGIQNSVAGKESNLEFGISNSAIHELGADHPAARYLELPPVQIVDLRAELKAGNRSMFSRALQREMARVLAAREQVILFLNRRGNATFILCRDCGRVFKCKRCDNPMTYHGSGDQLVCHHCNRRERVPTKCPQCGSARIRYFGVGTEKVEAEIQTLFPKARTLRWDWDVTQGKRGSAHEALLEKFVTRQADILIGTQMIAKGLDLPFVTLVGVISADTSLNLPDFRAGERTFQLLTQVAGRAGRSILGGKVIVQTYNPDHYAIVAASAHDYRAFYEREIAFRREQGYPPFNRLIRLIYHHTNNQRAQAESARMHSALMTRIAQRGLPSLDLIGPAPAFFHRVRGESRYQIILRGPDPHALIADLALPLGWRAEVDPVSVL